MTDHLIALPARQAGALRAALGLDYDRAPLASHEARAPNRLTEPRMMLTDMVSPNRSQL